MLCVPTYVAQSRIHGWGLFAAEPLVRGRLVWRFDPRVDRILTDEELEAEAQTSELPLRTFVYQAKPGLWVLCGDDAVYMNHAADPNCDDPDRTVARRDIAVGQELTVDYRLFDASAATWLDAVQPSPRRAATS